MSRVGGGGSMVMMRRERSSAKWAVWRMVDRCGILTLYAIYAIMRGWFHFGMDELYKLWKGGGLKSSFAYGNWFAERAERGTYAYHGVGKGIDVY